MSTLNTFGFNVRRKRHQDTHTSLTTKQVKTLPTPTLAFAAPATPSIYQTTKPQCNSPTIKVTPKSKTNKKQLPKILNNQLCYHSLQQQLPLPHSLPRHYPQKPATMHCKTQEQQSSDEEKNEICLIRRHVTMNELLPMLMDAFGEYCNDDLRDMAQHGKQQHRPEDTILLQVKPSKTMRAIQSEAMDYTNDNDDTHAISTLQRRRPRSSLTFSDDDDDDDDLATETLRTAFTYSLSLAPVKKRLCGRSSTKLRPQQRTISALFESGNERHLSVLEDEFNDQQQQQQQDDNEIHRVRRCLSTGQVNSLLLDIANEYLALENNSWCASYIDP
ncbi:unnamed protein product [Absidia cylindrospora]